MREYHRGVIHNSQSVGTTRQPSAVTGERTDEGGWHVRTGECHVAERGQSSRPCCSPVGPGGSCRPRVTCPRSRDVPGAGGSRGVEGRSASPQGWAAGRFGGDSSGLRRLRFFWARWKCSECEDGGGGTLRWRTERRGAVTLKGRGMCFVGYISVQPSKGFEGMEAGTPPLEAGDERDRIGPEDREPERAQLPLTGARAAHRSGLPALCSSSQHGVLLRPPPRLPETTQGTERRG